MNLPTNYDTTGKTLRVCTKTQTAFVKFLYDEGFNVKDDVVFNRTYLTTLANKHGVTWPPAWIVKDVSRCIKRGYYAVPELNDYIVEQAATAVVTTDNDSEEAHIVHDDLDSSIHVSDDLLTSMPI